MAGPLVRTNGPSGFTGLVISSSVSHFSRFGVLLICMPLPIHSYALEDEVRVLLVHGILHLCGLDHERGPSDERLMAEQEQRIMAAMGWQGEGLIEAQSRLEAQGEDTEPPPTATTRAPKVPGKGKSMGGGGGGGGSGGAGIPELGSIWAAASVGGGKGGGEGRSNVIRRAAVAAAAAAGQGATSRQAEDPTSASARKSSPAGPSGTTSKMAVGTTPSAGDAIDPSPTRRKGALPLASAPPRRSSDVRLVALDMDGTLLDSRSKILPSSVQVRGVQQSGWLGYAACNSSCVLSREGCQRVIMCADWKLLAPFAWLIIVTQSVLVHAFPGNKGCYKKGR